MTALSHVFDAADERFTSVSDDAFGRSAFIRAIVPPGPEALWPAIRKAGERGFFTALDIGRAASCAPSIAEAYLARLHAGGFVGQAGETTERRRLWALTSKRVLPPYVDGRGNPSHGHDVATRIWRALRMGKEFSLTGLCAALHDRDFSMPRETASLYLNALARAGYLDTIAAERICGEQRYKLKPHMVRGPLPPRLLRATLVYDPNAQALAGATVMAEEVRL